MSVATKMTLKKRRAFLACLAEFGNVSKACEAVNVSRDAIYKLRAKNKHFSNQWNEAVEVAADALEAEARRRAHGFDEQLSHQGYLTGDVVKRYSDTLLIFLLKGNKPEKFKDRFDVNSKSKVENTNTTVVFESNGREVLKK